MVMKVELISKELIKPSSTPQNHPSEYKICFLDQFAPIIYTRLLLCYEGNNDGIDHIERCLSLKKSLSEILTCFYPLAGRPTGDSVVIDCNDAGAEFRVARVPCDLLDFITGINDQDGLSVDDVLSPYLVHGNFENEVLLAIQYNVFDCGGFAIGLSFSHKVVDATSVLMFLKSWAAVSCGARATELVLPNFDAADHFPPQDVPRYLSMTGIDAKQKGVVKRFVFDKSSVASLQAAASSDVDSKEKRRTRVETVSAFLASRFLALSEAKSPEGRKMFASYHTVNLREKTSPPLTNTFGNLWRPAIQLLEDLPNKNDQVHIRSIATQISNSIKGVDGLFANSLKHGQWYTEMSKELGKPFIAGLIEVFIFTSWIRFPVYEIDFGWGKPAFVASPRRAYNNFTTLMSTKNGDGIEAWVTLSEDDMAAFESDPELMKFASSKN